MRLFWGKCRTLRQIRNEAGEYLAVFQNNSQLPNIIILVSFFGSISHHFKVHRVDIWLYLGFYGMRGEFLWGKVPDIEAATAWNRVIPCKCFRITHNYLILWFYHNVLVYLLIISRPIELTFDYIEVIWSKRWGSLWKSVGHWGRYGLKKFNPQKCFKNYSQLPNDNILLSFLIHFIIISRYTELIFDYIEVFWNKRWDYFGENVRHWGRYGMKQGNTLQFFKITHNCLISLF